MRTREETQQTIDCCNIEVEWAGVIKMCLVDILHACLLHIGWLGGWASLSLIQLPLNPETEFCCC